MVLNKYGFNKKKANNFNDLNNKRYSNHHHATMKNTITKSQATLLKKRFVASLYFA